MNFYNHILVLHSLVFIDRVELAMMQIKWYILKPTFNWTQSGNQTRDQRLTMEVLGPPYVDSKREPRSGFSMTKDNYAMHRLEIWPISRRIRGMLAS